MNRFIFHKRDHELTYLPMDFFFSYPFLVQLDLSNNQLFSLPLSISQCILLERIDISGNPMTRPPAVLFSLPKLRSNPHNIYFGKNQVCTEELAINIINDTSEIPQLSLQFEEVNIISHGNQKAIRSVTCAPDITTSLLFIMIHPEFQEFKNEILLVRKYKNHFLRIVPENVPISLYFIPGAIWSLELKYLPSKLSQCILPLVLSFIEEQMKIFPNDQVLKMNHNSILELQRNFTSFFANQVLYSLQSNWHLSSRHFKAQLRGRISGLPTDLLVTSTLDTVSICIPPSTYFVFNPSAISFDFVEDEKKPQSSTGILMCGDRGLMITDDSVTNLINLFEITLGEKSVQAFHHKQGRHIGEKDFLARATRQISIYTSFKDPRLIRDSPSLRNFETDHTKDSQILDYLRNVKSKYTRFTKISKEEVEKRNERIRLMKQIEKL